MSKLKDALNDYFDDNYPFSDSDIKKVEKTLIYF
jgi:hypothetical protein